VTLEHCDRPQDISIGQTSKAIKPEFIRPSNQGTIMSGSRFSQKPPKFANYQMKDPALFNRTANYEYFVVTRNIYHRVDNDTKD
jgi:hypothetical protein